MSKYKIPNVKTFEYTKIIGIENIEFGDYIIIDDFVLIYAKEKIKIGNHVHIASFVSISGGGGLIMGDFSGISSGCRIITGTDDFTDWGFGNPTTADQFRNPTIANITIGQFSIVGANSTIMPGVIIGEGCVVGANSVVTRNLESWGIYIGNKKIGGRNKQDILKNHKTFENEDILDRIGPQFK